MTQRLVLPPDEVADLCTRLRLRPPPGFEAAGPPTRARGAQEHLHPLLEAGVAALCGPRVAVLLRSTLGPVTAAVGMRGGHGGSMLRAGCSEIEVSSWLPAALDRELARMVPRLARGPRLTLQVPISGLARHPDLTDVLGTLHATVLAPPDVLGLALWLATPAGWLSIEPARVVENERWVTVRPVRPEELGAAVAPLVAAALA